MATTQHTPGPWTVDHERIGPPGEPVALLCDTTATEPGTVVEWPRFGAVADDSDDTENEANARLLASAPALLSALEDIVEDIRDDESFSSIEDIALLFRAEQAIAKAKEEVTQ